LEPILPIIVIAMDNSEARATPEVNELLSALDDSNDEVFDLF
jgi:hypothetical protein